jgi:hypothetical protein
MRVEQRGGGLKQRESDTRPYAERTLTVTTKLERFTRMAREKPQTRFNALMGLLSDPEGLRESFEREDGRKAPGVDGVRKFGQSFVRYQLHKDSSSSRIASKGGRATI